MICVMRVEHFEASIGPIIKKVMVLYASSVKGIFPEFAGPLDSGFAQVSRGRR